MKVSFAKNTLHLLMERSIERITQLKVNLRPGKINYTFIHEIHEKNILLPSSLLYN